MLLIVFEGNDQNSSHKPCPLLQPLTSDVLSKPASHLVDLSLNHFKKHLSPLIRREHLSLDLLKCQMDLDYPLFVYFSDLKKKNVNQFITEITCSLKNTKFLNSKEEEQMRNRKYSLKDAVVLIKQELKSKEVYKERIIKKGQISVLDKLLKENSQVFIKGKQIELIPSKIFQDSTHYKITWSQLITSRWSKYESENSCVYILMKNK